MKSLIVKGGVLSLLIGTGLMLNAADSKQAIEAEKIIPAIKSALDRDDYVEAVRQMLFYQVRTTLDVACSTDASARAAHDDLTVLQMSHPKASMIGTRVTFDKLNELEAEVVAQVASDLEANRLPAPTWVENHGMAPFLRMFGAQGANVSSFKPADQWQAIRRVELDKFKASLKTASDKK